jgi:hypothetical protein
MQKSHVADFFKIAEFAQVIVKVLSAIWIGGLEFRRAFDAQGNKRFYYIFENKNKCQKNITPFPLRKGSRSQSLNHVIQIQNILWFKLLCR